ncbi:MAG: hypothetical protein IJ166_06825 [Prevotella sp.]|nr:hypothetical protein [Prevotella sp.]
MRPIFFFFVGFFIQTSCVAKDMRCRVLCHQLDSILNLFIADHPDTKIVELLFENIGGEDYVTLSTASKYKKHFTDGYFFKDNILITYYSTDLRKRNDIINYENSTPFKDSIPGYHGEYVESEELVSSDDEIPIMLSYIIKSPTQFEEINNYDSIAINNKAKSNDGILNNKINYILNEYINNNLFVAYEIIVTKKKHIYLSIKGTFYYDKRYLDASFLRDNHIIFIYGINNANDIFDMEFINNYHNLPSTCREGPIIEYLNLPIPEKYIIRKNGKIYKVSDNDRMRLNRIKDLKKHFDS